MCEILSSLPFQSVRRALDAKMLGLLLRKFLCSGSTHIILSGSEGAGKELQN